MGKQSRLKAARRLIKAAGGIDRNALPILRPNEAFQMNAHSGKVKLRAKR